MGSQNNVIVKQEMTIAGVCFVKLIPKSSPGIEVQV
jgi:hypothetical protein